MSKKIFKRALFAILVATGSSLCITAIIITPLIPILIPVGSVCLAGAFGMYDGALASSRSSSSSSSRSHTPEPVSNHDCDVEILELEQEKGLYFMYSRNEEEHVIETSKLRLAKTI